jgi:hypothetical protein
MNLINRKSVLSIPGILFIILFQLLSGCYTQLDTTSLEKSKSVNNLFKDEDIDSGILGTWQKTLPREDAPWQIQQIIFKADHNLLFEEELGLTFGDKLSGRFSTKDSILTIVLDFGYGTEKYYYEVVNEKLTLTPIDMNKYFPYKVSGSGSRIWINPNYKKGNL